MYLSEWPRSLAMCVMIGCVVAAGSGCGPARRTAAARAPESATGTLASVSYKDRLIQRGSYHTVSKGETIYRIAKRYGRDPQLLMRVNKLDSAGTIEIGQMLFIPADGAKTSSKSAVPVTLQPARPSRKKTLAFIMPVKGLRQLKENVLFFSPEKDLTVRASEMGTVTFAGDLKGYGRTVIIEHGQGFSTVYAHLDTINTTVSALVAKAATIGICYAADSGQPFEFQLRREGKIVFPDPYISN